MELKPIGYYLPQLQKRLASRGKNQALPIVSLPTLNQKIWGLPEDKMVVIGSRTSMGKTSFALQLISDMSYADIPVLYISFEMTPDEILERMFVNRYRVRNFDLLTGKIDQYAKEYDQFHEKTKNLSLVMAQQFGKNWQEINGLFETINQHSAALRFKLVVIDYIQAIVDSGGSTKAFIDDYLLNFRNLCIKNKFCGIIISQLNRTSPESTDKRPQLHHLKGSGFLEDHADMVLLLDWAFKTGHSTDESQYYVNVAKNRNGPTGFVELKFIPEFYLFEDIESMKEKAQTNWNE